MERHMQLAGVGGGVAVIAADEVDVLVPGRCRVIELAPRNGDEVATTRDVEMAVERIVDGAMIHPDVSWELLAGDAIILAVAARIGDVEVADDDVGAVVQAKITDDGSIGADADDGLVVAHEGIAVCPERDGTMNPQNRR